MAHLLSPTNLELMNDESFPTDQRMGLINNLMASCKALMMIYMQPESQGLHFDRELVHVGIFQSRLGRILLALVLRFISQMTPEQTASPVRRGGWQKTWTGIAADVGGRLAMISERSHYREAERRLLALDVDETLALYFPYLPELTRREIPVRVEELIREEESDEVKAALKRILGTVRGEFPDPWVWPETSASPPPKEPAPALPQPRVLKSQAGRPGKDGWVAARASNGSFSVSFPGLYDERVLEGGEPDKGGIRTLSMVSRTPEGATFAVLSITRLDGNPPKEGALERLVKSFKEKGDLRNARDLSREGLRGKEVETWSRTSEAREQVWVKGIHLFALIVEVPFGKTETLRKDGDRFFSSLKLE